MGNFEKSVDISSIGQQIGNDLGAHRWEDASATLSRYASDLSQQEFTRLIQAADRANDDLSGITLEAVYDLARLPARDPVTGIESTALAKNFAGVAVGLNVQGFEGQSVLVTSPEELAPEVLRFGCIYNQMGLSAQKPADSQF
jgi:hypothetical protein